MIYIQILASKITKYWLKQKSNQNYKREKDYLWYGTKKIKHQNVWTKNRVLKITMIYQPKVELQENKKSKGREWKKE